MVGQARFELIDAADFRDGVNGQHDRAAHRDDELHEVRHHHTPQPTEHRVEHGDQEHGNECLERIDAQNDTEDFDHREVDPTHDDQVDGTRHVQRAKDAERCGGFAAVANFCEFNV